MPLLACQLSIRAAIRPRRIPFLADRPPPRGHGRREEAHRDLRDHVGFGDRAGAARTTDARLIAALAT